MQPGFRGQWGLRGDPLLWDALQNALSQTPLPPTTSALRSLLQSAYLEETGHEPSASDTPLPVASLKRPNGGMSNGLVSPRFWVETGFPTIERAFTDQRGKP